VKIRGQRVELGEIEAVLSGAPNAGAATVIAREHAGGTQLIAFVEGSGSDLVERLGRHARDMLPGHMVPNRIVVLTELPLGSSGKVDRGALGRMALPEDAPRATARVAMSLAEQQIVEAMSACLGRTIRPDDDFFAEGGHSLLALHLVGELERRFARTVALADVFEAPTPESLARRLAVGSTSSGDDLAPLLPLRLPVDGTTPLFLLPPAGGLGWAYLAILRHLPASQPVYAVQNDGMDGSRVNRPGSLDELAARQLELIRSVVQDRPFHLLGWSIGGMAAHTVAAFAASSGQQVGAVVLLDAYPADQWSQLEVPTESEALLGVLRLAGVEHMVDRPEQLNRDTAVGLLRAAGHPLAGLPDVVLSASIRSVLDAAVLIRRSRQHLYNGDVLMVRATAPRRETWLDAQGWRRYVNGRLSTHDVATSHPDIVREPARGARLGGPGRRRPGALASGRGSAHQRGTATTRRVATLGRPPSLRRGAHSRASVRRHLARRVVGGRLLAWDPAWDPAWDRAWDSPGQHVINRADMRPLRGTARPAAARRSARRPSQPFALGRVGRRGRGGSAGWHRYRGRETRAVELGRLRCPIRLSRGRTLLGRRRPQRR
jgi:enterobactin synthetase component F